MQERFELLSAMPVFGGLAEGTLQFLTEHAELRAIKEGDHFFRENEDSQSMYVLQSGSVQIYKSWKGEQKLLRQMEAGDCFGEMALIDFSPRSASAVAISDCEALEITAAVLQRIHGYDAEQFTLLQMNIGREVSRRLRRMDELLFRSLMGETLPATAISDLS